jgi:hypothetical protein
MEATQDTWYFVLFSVMFALVAVVKVADEEYLTTLLKGLFDSNNFYRLKRDGKLSWKITDLLLDLNFVSCISLLGMKFCAVNDLSVLPLIITFVTGYYLIKVFSVKLFSHVFFGNVSYNPHLNEVLAFNKIAGLFLLPLLFVKYFVNEELQGYMLIITISLVVLLYIFRLARIFLQMHSNYSYGSLYYFLYLCAIEISPYLVLFKAFLVGYHN